MAAADEIVLWKAPPYPGNGPYFTTIRAIADDYLKHYQAGIQAIYMPRTLFADLVQQEIIVADPLYAEGESYHVPPAGLAVFNLAIRQGTPNEYHAI